MIDHFARLGMTKAFHIDEAELESKYLALSRACHPDFNQHLSADQQRDNLANAAALNESYAIVRDPFRRAEHLLMSVGGPSAATQKEMPADFLEEMLELRMTIAEMEANPQAHHEKEALRKQLENRRDSLVNEAGQLLESFQNGGGPQRLNHVRRLLNSVKYVAGLLNDLDSPIF